MYIIQEIVIVVIGVLIAVLISNYREKSEDEKFIQKTLLAIENEIRLSKSEVDTVLSKHQQIVEYLSENLENDEETLIEVVMKVGGIQSPGVKNISLRFFISNKAELVSFEVISQLSEIEATQALLFEKMNRLIDFIFENPNEKDSDTKIKLIYYLANVIDSEKTLLMRYSDFVETNEALLLENTKQQ